MKFNYLSYGTSYGYKISQIIDGKKKSCSYQTGMLTFTEGKPDYDACFFTLYSHPGNDFSIDVNYNIDLAIIVAKDELSAKTHNKDNYTFLTKEEFLFFLEISIPTLGFSYKVTELESFYRINIEGKDISHQQTKFLTTWVRYTYEHPYNACMGETVRLFQLGVFKELDIFNAFLLTSRGWSSWGTGHSTADSYKIINLLPVPELLEKLKTKGAGGYGSLNSLYDAMILPSGAGYFVRSEFDDEYNILKDAAILDRWKKVYLSNIKLNNTMALDSFYIVSKNFKVELKSECKHLFLPKVQEAPKKKGVNGRVPNLKEVKVGKEKKEEINWEF